MATPTFHGITGAEYRDKGSSGSYTAINKLSAADSKLSRTPVEGPQNSSSGSYYGGENPVAEVMHLDATAHNALAAKYAADEEIELRLTLVGGGQETVTGLPQVNRGEVKGLAGDRVSYALTVRAFATSPAV